MAEIRFTGDAADTRRRVEKASGKLTRRVFSKRRKSFIVALSIIGPATALSAVGVKYLAQRNDSPLGPEAASVSSSKVDSDKAPHQGSATGHSGVTPTGPILRPDVLLSAIPLNQRPENFERGLVMPVSQVAKIITSRKRDRALDNRKIVFLTIDDGPSRVTPQVLDVLKKYRVHATFFVLGRCASSRPNLIKREWDEGHAIANHSWYHRYRHTVAAFRSEVSLTERCLKKILKDRDPLFESGVVRFPGGSAGRSAAIRKAYRQGEFTEIDWNVSSGDTDAVCVTAEKIAKTVKAHASHNGRRVEVVLVHDAGAKRSLPKALHGIIKYYKKMGYQFGTLCSDETWRDVQYIVKNHENPFIRAPFYALKDILDERIIDSRVCNFSVQSAFPARSMAWVFPPASTSTSFFLKGRPTSKR